MRTVLFLIFMLCSADCFSQRSMSDFLDEKCDVIWFGLDFSKARMIGEAGFTDPVSIKEEYFQKWNNLMISEGDKYDWGKALQISDLKYDYEVVDLVNDMVKVKSLVINKSYSIPEVELLAAPNAYQLTDYKDGIGVVVVVESFDKIKEQGFGHLIIFDISSKKVLYKHRLIGAAGNAGFRNHWARAIYNWTKYTGGRVMKDIKKEFK